MGLEGQCAYSGEARGSGARPGHRAFSYEDGEMELREKPAEEELYPSLSLLPPPIRDQELERRGGVAGEGIWWRHLRTSAGEEGRRAGGGSWHRLQEQQEPTALGHRSHFRSGPGPWQAPEQSLPPESAREDGCV